MEMNKNVINGKWMEIKGDLQKAWGKISDDEFEKTKGDIKSIRGLIQQRYGGTEESYTSKLDGIFAKFAEKKDTIITTAKDHLKDQKPNQTENRPNHQENRPSHQDSMSSHQEQARQ